MNYFPVRILMCRIRGQGPEREYHEAFKLIDAACEKIIEKALQELRYLPTGQAGKAKTNNK
jgi:hypothetical protein